MPICGLELFAQATISGQSVSTTVRLELIARAIDRVVASLRIDTEEVRPWLAAELRALDAITEN